MEYYKDVIKVKGIDTENVPSKIKEEIAKIEILEQVENPDDEQKEVINDMNSVIVTGLIDYLAIENKQAQPPKPTETQSQPRKKAGFFDFLFS